MLTLHQTISTAKSGAATMKPVGALPSFIPATSRPKLVVVTSLQLTMLFYILRKVFKKSKAQYQNQVNVHIKFNPP